MIQHPKNSRKPQAPESPRRALPFDRPFQNVLRATTASVAALAITASAGAQVSEDFETFSSGSFTSTGDWTISTDPLQGPRTAEITTSGLDFKNSAYDIKGGNRALQLNLDATGQTPEPSDDFALFDFSSTPVGADGDTVEFQFLFQQTSIGGGFFTNIGVTGDVTAPRPSRFSSSSVTLRGTTQGRIWDSSGNRTPNNTSRNFSDGSTHLAIGRVTFDSAGDETYELWIDPTSTDLSTLTPSAVVTSDMGVTAFEGLGVFPNDDNNQTLTIDEFSVAVIPEPSVAGSLVGILALSLIGLRRRR